MYNEKIRLEELESYQILDTAPEEALNELAQVASLCCNVPISLITMISKHRQWFKSNIGLDVSETTREAAFCQHALQKPKELLIVNDSLKDPRFVNNPLVVGKPNIRFYAGAPLETPNGHVLGTLCVIDRKPRELTANQKKILQILAKKAIDYLNTRKTMLEQKDKIATNAAKLKKLTDNISGGIFQLKRSPNGSIKFEFISDGMKKLYPSIRMKQWGENPEAGLDMIHPDDLPKFKEHCKASFEHLTPLYCEYRVLSNNKNKWHVVKAKPEQLADGSVVWYGSFEDITSHIEYQMAMEQISFDISHVLRGPVTSLLGLTSMIADDKYISKINMKEHVGYIQSVAKEMETFTRNLNGIYEQKKQRIVN